MTINQDTFSEAKLSWEKDIPASNEYDDVYFSLVNGLEETQYVFIEANDLPARFRIEDSSKAHPSAPFILAEAGFGSGLNFLLSWKNWRSIETSRRRKLHFISFEKHPLSLPDLSKSLSKWPELADYAKQLCDAYPPIIKGQHTLTFESGNLTLTLVFGDIIEALPNYQFTADCWYLDGFSPNKNPDMWSPALFKEVARLSAEDGSFSTFAAASSVRKGLEDAGFEVKRKKGFGKKREMLYGCISEIGLKREYSDSLNWSRQSTAEANRQPLINRNLKYDAIIIGAGLAGITTAHSLSKRGINVAIFDERKKPVSGASGQSQLVMYAKFPSERNKTFNFVEHCLANSLQHYRFIQGQKPQSKFWHPCGVLQLAWNNKEEDKQTRFVNNIKFPDSFIRSIDSTEAAEKTGLPLNCGGLWFENAGWLDPKAYAETLLSPQNHSYGLIDTFFEEKVNTLSITKENTWLIESTSQRLESNNIIVCNSNDAKHFSQLSHLPTKPLRGQVTSVKEKKVHNKMLVREAKCVITGEGYLCPPVNGWHHFGATFDLDSEDTEVNPSDNLENFDTIQAWNPSWFENLKDASLSDFKVHSNAGLRCTTPDYIPIAGQAPIYDEMVESFAKLRVGANSCKHLYGHYYRGLYVNIGHGSKGAFTTPVAAELIASQICGGVMPVNETIRSMFSPARFIIKHLKQRRI